MDHFLTIYNEVAGEFFQDLKRRLEIKTHSASDPWAVSSLTNDFIASELAQLRAQMLDLDLRVSQIVTDPRRSALLSAATTIGMPRVYACGDSISMGDSIATYGFHMPEEVNTGTFRWSGPISSSGLIAHIDRSAPMTVTIPIMAYIAPDVRIVAIHVDGAPLPFVADDPHVIKFRLPPLAHDGEVFFTPTLLSFTVNKILRVSDISPASTDQRSLGVAIQRINLAAAKSPPG